MVGFEENTRHKSEDRPLSNDFIHRVKQNTLFLSVRSDSNPDSKSTESREPILLVTSTEQDVPWEL
jgi:hypothetical protein